MYDVLKVTLLGTGTPLPNIYAFGTSTLIEAGGETVMIDCGRGAAVRLSQAGHAVGAVDTVILSHYHSDHYAGIFDLLMTGAIPQKFANRGGPLHVYGPPGVECIADGLWEAGTPDRDIRVADGEVDPETMRIIPHTYKEGVVFERSGLKITAILVDHGEYIKPAYGFKVEYNGRVFVHSHDTRYNENLIAQSQGADVLVHEIAAASQETLDNYPKVKVAIDHHASPTDVGRVLNQVKPKLAFLTHLVLLPPDPVSIDDVLAEVALQYDGPVIVAEDLMTITLGRSLSVTPYYRGAKNF